MYIKIKRVSDLKITCFVWKNVDFVEYVDFAIGLE